MQSDGSRYKWLIIPAGGFRKPCDENTRKIKDLPDGNRRSEENLHMNGAGIFTFSQKDVPISINEFLKYAQLEINSIDYFILHQPNRFMLEKISKKLNIPKEKMPMNIVEKYGNSSSSSIPTTICHNLSDQLKDNTYRILTCGFGVGLTWGSIIMQMGPLDFCELIEMD